MFKKSAVWFFAVCVLLFPVLSGCSAQNLEAEDIDFTFSCKIDVKSDCGNMTCDFVRAGPQSADIGILSGDAEGLSYDWNGGEFTVSYGGLSVQNDSCALPSTSFAALLVGSLDCAQQKDALTRSREGEFSGRAEGFDFILKADVSTGQITEFSVPEKNLNVKFYE